MWFEASLRESVRRPDAAVLHLPVLFNVVRGVSSFEGYDRRWDMPHTWFVAQEQVLVDAEGYANDRVGKKGLLGGAVYRRQPVRVGWCKVK